MTIETLRAEIRDFVLNELLKGMVDESELQDNRQMIKDGLIDSIGIMRLLTFLSQTYNIELTDDDFKMKNFESIDKIPLLILRDNILVESLALMTLINTGTLVLNLDCLKCPFPMI